LESTTFSVGSGDAILITGSNGSGKSTLLDCIAGVQHPTSGDISTPGSEQPAYLPQNPPRPFAYTVREYLMIGNIPLQRADYATTFDITPLLDKEITALSAGQWQRVAITKILNTNRKVVALDEPDAPLDEHWSKCLEAAILDEISIGKIVIVTLHRPEIRKYWKFQCLNLTPMVAS
jgi:ABC-type cobalamin/Fe3+-siderophores transport system ATPase subunit